TSWNTFRKSGSFRSSKKSWMFWRLTPPSPLPPAQAWATSRKAAGANLPTLVGPATLPAANDSAVKRRRRIDQDRRRRVDHPFGCGAPLVGHFWKPIDTGDALTASATAIAAPQGGC